MDTRGAQSQQYLRFTPGTYRRPYVQAVQLTDDTPWGAVADWCGGQFGGTDGDIRTYYVSVLNPGAIPTRAYVGDWVVMDQGRTSVMSDETFREKFTFVEPRSTADDDLARILGPRYRVPQQPHR